ncbi:MAG: sigma-70 family RNA polymerase sigma factor [Clostridia bacterium]|nr:sigma-70 family RNA polymerase sigma factor [Clostridia bacterium]
MLSSEALEAYSEQYYSMILKYCTYKLSNKEDGEDAAQETFFVFSKKAHLLDEGHIKYWLIATANNIILREYKKRRLSMERYVAFDENMDELSRSCHTFQESLVDCYEDRFIREVYERLTDKEKEIYFLVNDNRVKTADAAKILGIEPHAFSMRKKRFKERYRELLRECLFY